MKATELVEILNDLIAKHGEVLDVETFSGELGIYDMYGDEIKRINIED